MFKISCGVSDPCTYKRGGRVTGLVDSLGIRLAASRLNELAESNHILYFQTLKLQCQKALPHVRLFRYTMPT